MELLDQLFAYNPDTGVITRKTGGNSMQRGAGSVTGGFNGGYIAVCVKKVRYQAHRVAWKLYYRADPPQFIDHIDGDRSNNAIRNLRSLSHAENLQNCGPGKRNKSGIKGVSLHKTSGLWRANSQINGNRHHLGYFQDLEDAGSAIQTFKDANLAHLSRPKLDRNTEEGLTPHAARRAPKTAGGPRLPDGATLWEVAQWLQDMASWEKAQPYGRDMDAREWAAVCLQIAAEELRQQLL